MIAENTNQFSNKAVFLRVKNSIPEAIDCRISKGQGASYGIGSSCTITIDMKLEYRGAILFCAGISDLDVEDAIDNLFEAYKEMICKIEELTTKYNKNLDLKEDYFSLLLNQGARRRLFYNIDTFDFAINPFESIEPATIKNLNPIDTIIEFTKIDKL